MTADFVTAARGFDKLARNGLHWIPAPYQVRGKLYAGMTVVDGGLLSTSLQRLTGRT